MKKLNERGFSILELVLSFTLISILVMGMLGIVLNYRSTVKVSTRRIGLTEFKSTVTSTIQEDILKFGVSSINRCSNGAGGVKMTCVVFHFRNGTSKNLEYFNTAINNRYIQYGTRRFPIEEVIRTEYPSLSDATIHLPSDRNGITLETKSVGGSVVYKVHLPISADDFSEDFGILIVTTNNTVISPVIPY